MNMEVIRSNEPVEVNNVDILRRLSKLEKLVYANIKSDNEENKENN